MEIVATLTDLGHDAQFLPINERCAPYIYASINYLRHYRNKLRPVIYTVINTFGPYNDHQ